MAAFFQDKLIHFVSTVWADMQGSEIKVEESLKRDENELAIEDVNEGMEMSIESQLQDNESEAESENDVIMEEDSNIQIFDKSEEELPNDSQQESGNDSEMKKEEESNVENVFEDEKRFEFPITPLK